MRKFLGAFALLVAIALPLLLLAQGYGGGSTYGAGSTGTTGLAPGVDGGYVQRSGSTPLTGHWAVGGYSISGMATATTNHIATATLASTGNASIGGQLYCPVPTTMVPTGTTQTVDWNAANGQTLDLGSASGSVTLAFSNGQAGGSYVLAIIQSATARTLIWPGTVLWQGGTAVVLTTTNDAVDLVVCYFTGAAYYCNFGNDYQ